MTTALCRSCGRAFTITDDERTAVQALCRERGSVYREPMRCPPCRKQRRVPSVDAVTDEQRQCRDCGKDYSFSVGEQKFYAARNLSAPSRCPSCRAARRERTA